MKSLHNIMNAVVAGTLLCAAATQAQAAEQWRHYGTVAASHTFSKALIATFARIDQRTNGELKIQFVHYNETPHKATEALQVLRDELVQMTDWLPAYTTGTYPILGAPGLPFLLPEFHSVGETAAAADRAWASPIIKKQLDNLIAKHGGRTIGSYYYEPMNFYFNKPVVKLEDFAGKRLRVFSPEQATLAKELGATPVSLTSAEVYGALQRGLLDGVITSSGGVTDLKWGEQLNVAIMCHLMMVRTDILVSEAALKRLSPQVRAIFDEEMTKVSAELRRIITETDPRHHETMKKQNFTFVPCQGEMYQRLRNLSREKVWPTWAKAAGPDAQKALDEVISAMATK